MSHNCGCPQNSPSQLTCPASFSVPVDQFNCEETNQPQSPNAVVTYHQALSSFIVPSVGSQSALLVSNGALFTPGQWIQFVNPLGIFRIISITGNVLQLSNAAGDGVTAIAGNPAPPYQYPLNAAFVAVGDPRQQSLSEFAAYVASALATLQSVCLDNLESQGANEDVYLLGYLKSSLCDGESGACLRKQSLAYIDNAGILHFDGPISAEQFNVPVPEGGIPSNNTTSLNPNNGTGGGFLLPFYNPSTGLASYIDLFSGIENNSAYSFYISSSGLISLIPSGGRRVFWPDKEVHKGSGASYSGFTSADIDIATYAEEPVPAWAKYVKVRVSGNLFSGASDSIRVKLNTETVLYTSMETDYRGTYDQDFTIPITNGKFNLEIITYTDASGTILGAANLGTGANARAGFIRVAITELLS